MNQAFRALLGCSGSIAIVLVTGNIASPDTNQTIPFPEVVNLKKVPRFNAQGILPQLQIAHKSTTKPYLSMQSIDGRDRSPAEVAIDRFGCDCPSCQNRARADGNRT